MSESGVAERSSVPGGSVELRPVTPEDEEFLLGVYSSTREEEVSQVVWPPGQKEAFLRSQFEAQREQYFARFPDAQYDVILLDGRPAGRLWIGRDSRQIRLLDIALLPEAQNRGAGTLLLRRLMEEARASGKKLRHMIFVMNDDARRFYERLGFVVTEDVGAYLHMEWRPGTEATVTDGSS